MRQTMERRMSESDEDDHAKSITVGFRGVTNRLNGYVAHAYLGSEREMMQQWADYLDNLKT